MSQNHVRHKCILMNRQALFDSSTLFFSGSTVLEFAGEVNSRGCLRILQCGLKQSATRDSETMQIYRRLSSKNITTDYMCALGRSHYLGLLDILRSPQVKQYHHLRSFRDRVLGTGCASTHHVQAQMPNFHLHVVEMTEVPICFTQQSSEKASSIPGAA